MIRWCVPVSCASELPAAALDVLLALLPEGDARDVRRFRRPEDRARCLLSRLAQRAVASAALGIDGSPPLRRAANGRGRPFFDRATALAGAGPDAREALEAAANFNFSVSHEGDWVVLAAEPLALCGVDVAAPRARPAAAAAAAAKAATAAAAAAQGCPPDPHRPHPYLASLALLRDSLTDAEWAEVEAPLRAWAARGAEEEGSQGGGGGGSGGGGGGGGREEEEEEEAVGLAEAAFLRAWAVKEAFVKARGDGLAFAPLSRIEAVWRGAAAADERGGGAGAEALASPASASAAPPPFGDARAVALAAAAGAPFAVGTLRIDGGPALWGRWAVALHPLGQEDGGGSGPRGPPGRRRPHAWIAVVRGPPSGAAPRELHADFVDSLAARDLDGDALRAAVERAPWLAFRSLKVEDLLMSDGEREALAAAVALAAGAGGGGGGQASP